MENPNSLIEQASILKTIAGSVLEESNLLLRLAPLGKIEIIGSLRLGLMYRKDIDLLVVSEKVDRKKAVEAAKNLLDDGYFQTVELMDYQQFPEYDFPLGFYFGLRVPIKGEYWKLDVWYLRPDEGYTQLVLTALDRFESELAQNPFKAGIVLEIKQHYFDGTKYRDGIKSINIYKAVFDANVTGLEEFNRYLTANNSR